ncbi:hypothetical protein CL629_01650 [bacterium]|nr:hypothetical protein [bacterium]|tara:strand:- start:5825 stop:7027 length:1203 start_codon:yes stop_codon:yes gene_type:complete
MTIQDIRIRQIFDSRGDKTLEIVLYDAGGREFTAQIPSGKGRGEEEVQSFDYEKAEDVLLNILKKEIVGKDLPSVMELDKALIALDGTPSKEKIGGNVMLGISIAFARALAFQEKKQLWEIFRGEFFSGIAEEKKPLIFSNFINGGVHARNNLDIQEYLVVVDPKDSLVDSIHRLSVLYKNLGTFLEQRDNVNNPPIGDESGYSVDFPNNFEPLNVLGEFITEFHLENEVLIGLDAAASGFYKDGKYVFESNTFSNEDLLSLYVDYYRRSKFLYSIEDPFDPEDGESFRKLLGELRDKLVVGDDLTTTHPDSIEKYATMEAVNSVIIKPNQIGTVSEACQAMKIARERKVKTIVSHRSGETEDNFIIHLAKAGGADGVKIGVPVHERIFKFNELIRVYED